MAQRDSSLLFSLKELEGLEHERVARERREQVDREQAAERARSESAARERALEARRIAEEEERRVAAERSRAEEAIRLGALQRGIVERARAETEARVAVELARSRDAHELSLVQARASASRTKDRLLLALSVAALGGVTVLAAVLAARVQDLTRLDQARAVVAAREREGCARAVESLGTTRRELDELAGQLRQLEQARAPVAAAPAAPARGPLRAPTRSQDRPSPAAARSPATCRGDGDPLNGCLPATP